MPLKKPGLSFLAPTEEEEEGQNGHTAVNDEPTLMGAAVQSGARPLKSQASFTLSSTMTFNQDGITLSGGRGLIEADGAETSSLRLSELERVRRLGSGATSHVYLCKHRATGELYAVKELTAMADADTRRMAVNELRIARAARGEHLIRFVDAFFDEGKISIALEFADAGSLDDVIRRSKGIPEPQLSIITVQMLHGLLYLHREMHQVHRDLKPANVMLTRRGDVKLSDFGISKQLESTAALAITQCGTTMYMSPERLQGESYSYVSDVWSAGLIVLEALIGRAPYPAAKSFMGLLCAICDEEPPQVPATHGAQARAIVAECLTKDPSCRPKVSVLQQHAWFAEHSGGAEPAISSAALGGWLVELLLR
jgi:serine/threonine protein kinase